MSDFFFPMRPADAAENSLIDSILRGQFPPGAKLPAERELAVQLGVTRPTLREALQRLSRDGWIEIRQGKPTKVKNYLLQGNLLILNALARHPAALPPQFLVQLLEVRTILAPHYYRLAFERQPEKVLDLLTSYQSLREDPQEYSKVDQDLHIQMAALSGNPIFSMILNGFTGLLSRFGALYFRLPENRADSAAFYQGLLYAARTGNAQALEKLTEEVMIKSIENWCKAVCEGGLIG